MVTTPIITFIADPREPDLYNDVSDLPNPFTLNVPIGIANTHPTQTLYFKISILSPPAAYSVSSTNFGFLTVGQSAIFVFTAVRNQPTLTAGEFDETLTFQVDAYTDSDYTAFYANQTLSVTIHHFNHTDASWTILGHYDFDDGTTQGWTTDNLSIEGSKCVFYSRTNFFLTSPYSLASMVGVNGSTYKTFNTGGFTKARAVFHVFEHDYYGQGPAVIMIDGALKKSKALLLPANQWTRLSFNIPIGSAEQIRIAGGHGGNSETYFDEIWIIAK
jgi:hypothetical protein